MWLLRIWWKGVTVYVFLYMYIYICMYITVWEISIWDPFYQVSSFFCEPRWGNKGKNHRFLRLHPTAFWVLGEFLPLTTLTWVFRKPSFRVVSFLGRTSRVVHHFGAQERRVIGGDIFFRGPKVSGGPQSLQNFSFATGQELMVFTSPTNCCHTPTQSCRQATEGKSCFLRFSFFLGRLGGLRAINETLSPFKMSVCPGASVRVVTPALGEKIRGTSLGLCLFIPVLIMFDFNFHKYHTHQISPENKKSARVFYPLTRMSMRESHPRPTSPYIPGKLIIHTNLSPTRWAPYS